MDQIQVAPGPSLQYPFFVHVLRVGAPQWLFEELDREFRWRLCYPSRMVDRWGRILVGTVAGLFLVGIGGCQLGIPDKIARTLFRNRFQAFPGDKSFASLPAARDTTIASPKLLNPADLLVTTAIWPVHLEFTREAWLAMAPEKFEPIKVTRNEDGSRRLRNPDAERAGILGVFGLHLPWSVARDAQIAGQPLKEVAARFKGNGTFIEAMRDYKRSFKLDFNDTLKDQRLAGLSKLNLNNLSQDVSFLQEALAAEYYRDAGVLASRTAFADVSLTIDSEGARRRLGLYLIVENADGSWVKERFGKAGAALWKPVTTSLFVDRGTNWNAYAGDYQPRTDLKPEDERRVSDFASLVSRADNEEFDRRLSEFLDLDSFARFLAAEVLTSNYDSFIGLGQNYLLYLNRSTGRFGFAPWDLDHGWGEFFLVGSQRDKEEASIWRPWIGQNLFLERVMAVSDFRERYRRELERQLQTVFVPERLVKRIDGMAALVRPYLEGESERRLRRFERAASHDSRDDGYSLEKFIFAREKSVRDQLAGRAEGKQLKRKAFF